MKAPLSLFVVSFLLAFTNAWALPKYGPNAEPLASGAGLEYFKSHKAPDFWALVSYYLPQESDSGCSAANFAMVLNAARDVGKMSSSDKLVTIHSLLEKYTDPRYSAAMSGKISLEKLDHSIVSNANLAKVLQAALKSSGAAMPTTHVDAVAVDEKNLDKSKAAFHDALVQNEKSADDFIVISFVQGILTGDPEGGAHVATIGAYDEKRKSVLIFDPDREWYGPYWSPESKVFEAIADPRSDYASPGWLYVKIR
jgi:hypothetical protein